MNTEDLQHFFDTHPAITKSVFCDEAGITPQYLGMILRGDRPLTHYTIAKLEPVMRRYGW